MQSRRVGQIELKWHNMYKASRFPLGLCSLLLCFVATSYTLSSVLLTQSNLLNLRTSAHLHATHKQAHALTQVLQSQTAAKFSIYYGSRGSCGAGLIQYFGVSLDLEEIMTHCLRNPNCTFFSYHHKHGGQVCCGRAGDSDTGELVVDGITYASGWISGDRRGCERYTTSQAATAHQAGSQPLCYKQQAPGCPFYSASGHCVTSMLKYNNKALTLSDDVGEELLCEVDGASVLVPATDKPAPGCKWQPGKDGKKDYYNMHHKHHLFANDVTYRAGLLALTDHCLCDNRESGLVVGPYCANEDCKWDYANSSCVYQSRVNKRCLTTLSNIKSDTKCLCEDEWGNYATGQGKGACNRAECKWQMNKGKQVNAATKRAFGAGLAYELDGSLLARRQQCICDVNGKLMFSQECGGTNCQWERNERPVLDLVDPLYDIKEGVKVQCVAALLPVQHTATLKEALQLCNHEKQCTTVVYNTNTGATFVCRGQYKDPDPFVTDSSLWVSAVRQGCRSSTEQATFSMLAEYGIADCYTRDTSTCRGCPVGLMQTSGCTVDKPAICDTSPHGFAGQWPSSHAIQDFQEPLQQLARSMGKDSLEYRSFNPSVFQFENEAYVVFRMANNTLCGKDKFEDQEGQVFLSRLGLCKLDPSTHLPEDCRELMFNIEDIVSPSAHMQMHSVFKGVEDPRGFTFQGKVYVSVTINLEHKNSIKSGFVEQHMALLTIDTNLQRVERSVILRQPYLPGVLTQKNWGALVHQDKLYFVAGIAPLHIVKPNLITGECELVVASRVPVSHQKRLVQITAGEPIRGGTQFIATPWGYMALGHRKKEYALGPIYTHHIVMIEDDPDNVFRVKWTSPGFRLPDIPGIGRARYQGVQFASGVVLKSDRLYVSYGVADCHAAFAEISQFYSNSEFWGSASLSQFPAPMLTSTRTKVRWEGIASDYSSLAIVTREMMSRMQARAPHVQFEIMDLGTTRKTAEDDLDEINRMLITTNEQYIVHPNVVVRMHWPPNFHKPMARHWVQFLPWEFETIPIAWVDALNANASEVWAPSHFVRDGIVKSGLNPAKVYVVPHGVNMETCNDAVSVPDNVTATLPFMATARSFKLLFQGGALWRKGLDTLLDAYALQFTAADDVTLIVHVAYGDPQVMEMLSVKFQAFQQRPNMPHILPVGDELTDEQNAMLYRVVDAYVHPARAEGYGMTIVEAMAAGLPTIVPSKGGQADFTNSDVAYLAPATMTPCDKPPCRISDNGDMHVFHWKLSQQPRWAEVDPVVLGQLLRHVYNNPQERAATAQRGKEYVCGEVTWDRAADIAMQRLNHLLEV